MNRTEFDAITKSASRRGSLLALGGAGLATLIGASGSTAKPKPGKRARKKVKDKCKAQVGQCDLFVGLTCAKNSDPAACKAGLLPCCDFLASCNAGRMMECLASGGVAP
jgi:hypothetical protein